MDLQPPAQPLLCCCVWMFVYPKHTKYYKVKVDSLRMKPSVI